MKKILLLALAAAFTLNASAEGYQVNTLSAKQLGMGHTSVSQKLNSESVWFNPAAAAYQEQKFSVSAGVTGIMALATATTKNDYTNPTTTYESDNDWSTPMYLYANYKVTDDLALGLSFNTPFGSSMNWGKNWDSAGEVFVQDISLTAYTLQPTISYKFLDGKLSVGAGLMMTWGNYEQSKALLSNVADVTMSGDAGMKFGYNIGIMYDINEKWSLGASYRSKIDIAVEDGEADVQYASSDIKTNVYANQSTYATLIGTEMLMSQGFDAELPLPATLSVGATFYPADKWTISTEVQWVQWSAYESLDVDFSGTVISNTKNYSDTFMVRVGGQYEINDFITGRLGFYVDQSPVASDYLNPETPSMTKVGYTGGVSIMPIKKCRDFSIDLAYAYITSADPERAGAIYDATTGTTFEANYTAKAHTVALGASWAF